MSTEPDVQQQLDELRQNIADIAKNVKALTAQGTQAPAAPPQIIIEERGKPVPFRKEDLDNFASTIEGGGTPPTTLRDCMKAGGHGGKDGTNVYYANPHLELNHDTGEMEIVKGPRICGTCGSVGI